MDGNCKGCPDIGVCGFGINSVIRQICPCKRCVVKIVCITPCYEYTKLLDDAWRKYKEEDEK